AVCRSLCIYFIFILPFLFFRFNLISFFSIFFFFTDPATTEIYTLSLHDALPISSRTSGPRFRSDRSQFVSGNRDSGRNRKNIRGDRKSTRLNSSHVAISYAVFCLKKKKKKKKKKKNNK